MGELTRRDALLVLAGVPLVATGVTPAAVRRAVANARAAIASSPAFVPQFFTAHEYATARVLAELVIPRDGRSGGALDAGVPEFMDFILQENPGMQPGIRGGLAWLDREALERFSREFVQLADRERRSILDDIAWPPRAKAEHAQGVNFFNAFRDLTASGFFSSEIGVRDLRYQGNALVQEWRGCPPEALAKLGVGYDS
jgi:hypothetical protein